MEERFILTQVLEISTSWSLGFLFLGQVRQRIFVEGCNLANLLTLWQPGNRDREMNGPGTKYTL